MPIYKEPNSHYKHTKMKQSFCLQTILYKAPKKKNLTSVSGTPSVSYSSKHTLFLVWHSISPVHFFSLIL